MLKHYWVNILFIYCKLHLVLNNIVNSQNLNQLKLHSMIVKNSLVKICNSNICNLTTFYKNNPYYLLYKCLKPIEKTWCKQSCNIEQNIIIKQKIQNILYVMYKIYILSCKKYPINYRAVLNNSIFNYVSLY